MLGSNIGFPSFRHFNIPTSRVYTLYTFNVDLNEKLCPPFGGVLAEERSSSSRTLGMTTAFCSVLVKKIDNVSFFDTDSSFTTAPIFFTQINRILDITHIR